MNAIVVTNVNNFLQSVPLHFMQLASTRWNCDLVISEKSWTHPARAKIYNAYENLLIYDNILLLDADTIINPITPDPFPRRGAVRNAPKDSLYEFELIEYEKKDLALYNHVHIPFYFNTGVIFLDKSDIPFILKTIELDKLPETELARWWDQTILNIAFENKMPELDETWNFIPHGRPYLDEYIIHFAGGPKDYPPIEIFRRES